MLLHDSPSEALIQFCWKVLRKEFQLLTTQNGKPVQVIKAGTWNTNQGPDFLHAHIRMDGIDFYGHVEIHVAGDDWYRHKHHLDSHFNSTILHIVWKSGNRPVIREDGSSIPECEIRSLVPKSLLLKIDRLRLTEAAVPCEAFLPDIHILHKEHVLTRAGVSRFQQKLASLQTRLTDNISDWLQLLWEELALRMGGPVNGPAFEALAKKVPTSIWRHYSSDRNMLEALLLGASGILPRTTLGDPYVSILAENWKYLSHKHRIETTPTALMKWARMRPASLPTIRLSQLAGILTKHQGLLDLLDSQNWNSFLNDGYEVSTYWESHYQFFKEKPARKKALGRNQKYVVLINTLIPLAYLFASSKKKQNLHDWLENNLTRIPPEENRITRLMASLSFPNHNALYSQGMLELKRNHCDLKKCLECEIGYKILTPRRNGQSGLNRT